MHASSISSSSGEMRYRQPSTDEEGSNSILGKLPASASEPEKERTKAMDEMRLKEMQSLHIVNSIAKWSDHLIQHPLG